MLHFWLMHTPDFDEVTRWYLGWKAHFPPAILDHDRVRRQFNAALDLMNNAVEGGGLGPGGDFAAAAASAAVGGRWGMPEPSEASTTGGRAGAPAAVAPSHWAPAAELTLKDLVQRFAEESDVEFMPKIGRFQDGLQVYAFGSVSIVLESTQNVVRAQIRDGRWAPVSLETLLQQNVSKPAVKRATVGAARM